MRAHGRLPGLVYTGKRFIVRECQQSATHGFNYYVEPAGTFLDESIAHKFLTQEAAIEWVRQEEGKRATSRVCLFICGGN